MKRRASRGFSNVGLLQLVCSSGLCGVYALLFTTAFQWQCFSDFQRLIVFPEPVVSSVVGRLILPPYGILRRKGSSISVCLDRAQLRSPSARFLAGRNVVTTRSFFERKQHGTVELVPNRQTVASRRGVTSGGKSTVSSLEEEMENYKVPETMATFVRKFAAMPDDVVYRTQYLCSLGNKCARLPPRYKVRENQVLGCQSLVHIVANAKKDASGTWRFYFYGSSDGLLTKGLLYLLTTGLSGCTLKAVEGIRPEFGVLFGVQKLLAMSRINGFMNMILKMKDQARRVSEEIEAKTKKASGAT